MLLDLQMSTLKLKCRRGTGIRAALDFTIQMDSEVLFSYRTYTPNKKTKIQIKFSPLLHLTKVDSSGMSKPGLKPKSWKRRYKTQT